MSEGHAARGRRLSSFDMGSDAYNMGRWADALKHFLAADKRETLQPDMLERLATAAYLVGGNDLSTESWTRAHQAYQDRADPISAARCAFWLGFQLLNSGAQASGFGWIARSGRLLADVHEECSEKGYIVLAGALQSIFGGEAEAAFDSFGEAAAIGHRVGDADLVALSSPRARAGSTPPREGLRRHPIARRGNGVDHGGRGVRPGERGRLLQCDRGVP